MSENIDWGERLELVLKGALAVWRVEGRVARENSLCTVQTSEFAVTVQRITDDGDPYWEVASHEEGLPPLPFAGIQGMLRAVRQALDADATGSRLVIGPGGNG
jgi:hypothetical protein